MKNKKAKENRTHRVSLRSRISAVAALLAAAALLLYFGIGSDRLESLSPIPENALVDKPTLNLWYTDESLSDFLAAAALDFSEGSEVRVIPRLVSGLEYLESINEASLNTNMVPDVYILGNESLEKAWLSGLACEIRNGEGYVSTEHFPEAAIRAVTYQNRLIGYPFYYETSALVYNLSYLETAAADQLQAEADALAGQEAMAALDENGEPVQAENAGSADGEDADGSSTSGGSTNGEGTDGSGTSVGDADNDGTDSQDAQNGGPDSQIAQRTQELIPADIDDILSFADSYNAPEQVEAVFRWDVSDVFYNYFFIGNYVDVGGTYGDDEEQIDIYNLDAIRCLSAYQELTQYFSIDPEEVSYESVAQEFLDGKLVFTIATTDILSRLEQAAADGSFPYAYGVARVPDIGGLEARSLSVTSAVVVNGYSEKKDVANEFARYLTESAAERLYESSGKLPADTQVTLPSEQAAVFAEEYAASVPIPKMMTTSNYWVQMEIAFTRVWNGEEVSAVLKDISEQIMTQVTGEAYTEEYIEPPVEETQAEENQEGEADF
ncbi:MAG TPA: sugar ABC transporter substrate-binding protein [Candidatus Eisenbergiella merdavium]|uniref:Sugar ABC transporter substrate-binding protein n=1 Tax=Candidatus Eisenbergiella merdavium TaxID=2838551 RepID=A0A9D2NFR2_9FIRM|nr:sugar ABC transporter substrate-binding protein [Candidatus Eisenbergiella merdavium]